MHTSLEVAQTIFLFEHRRQMLDATRNSFVIVVRCYGTDLANEIKTQPSVASLTNSLRLLDFR